MASGIVVYGSILPWFSRDTFLEFWASGVMVFFFLGIEPCIYVNIYLCMYQKENLPKLNIPFVVVSRTKSITKDDRFG